MMHDQFGRTIDYLRISVTDRCNFRCHYCMPEKMTFMPKTELLSLEEIAIIAERFIAHGVKKIRLTGGEPLVRRDMKQVVERLGRHVKNGALEELTLTTNASLLAEHAKHLADNGVRRINISLDTLDPSLFASISRGARLSDVMAGIAAAKAEGLKIKINMVALKGENETSLLPMAEYCAKQGFDLALIETMPLGAIESDREDHYISLHDFTAPLRDLYSIVPSDFSSAGPARYQNVEPLGLRLATITPLSHNFCDACNRIRLTTDGKIYMCLGHDAHVDLRDAVRTNGIESVDALLKNALRLKPLRHDFENQMNSNAENVERHMSVTGG